MELALLERIRAEARPLLAARDGRRVVVWGAGELGSWLMDELGDGGLAFVDANPTKHGTRIAGREVHPIEALDTLERDEVWVAVLSDLESITDELAGRGLVEGRDFRVPFPSGKRAQWDAGLPRVLDILAAGELEGAEVLEVGFGGRLFLALTALWCGARRVTVTDVATQTGALERHRAGWLDYLDHLGREHGNARRTRREPAALLDAIEIHAAPVSASQLPFDDASFDGVLNTGVMEHVDDPEVAIAEYARVLRPGGRALCAAIGIHDHRANDPRSGFTPWSFLAHTEAEWRELGGGAYHQNRRRAVDFRRAFERFGFELIRSESSTDRAPTADELACFAPEFRERYTPAELAELDLWLAARRLA